MEGWQLPNRCLPEKIHTMMRMFFHQDGRLIKNTIHKVRLITRTSGAFQEQSRILGTLFSEVKVGCYGHGYGYQCTLFADNRLISDFLGWLGIRGI